MKKIICTLLTLILLLSMTIPASASGGYTTNAAEARNGVVRFFCHDYAEDSSWVGSGFAIGDAGQPAFIFGTNHHVVDGADLIYILLDDLWALSVPELGGADDSLHAVSCEVVYDNTTGPDYAIVRAKRVITERVALPLMPSHLALPGDTVYALGYPGVADDIDNKLSASIDAMTVTKGTISRFTVLTSEKANVIQTDTYINNGNSGGPLITEEGYIIGINTWKYQDSAMNLSLEIDYVIESLNNLISTGVLQHFTYTLITDRQAGTPVVPADPTLPATIPNLPSDEETQATETTAPIDEPEPDPNSNLIWIIAGGGAVVAAIVLVLILKKRGQGGSNNGGSNVNVNYGATVPDAPPQHANVYLVGVGGLYAGRRFPVSGNMRIGRGGCDISYPDGTPGVSGNHAHVSPSANGIVLTDVGSSLGTFLGNGTTLNRNQPYSLGNGDIFYLGGKTQCFRVEIPGAPSKSQAVPANYYLVSTGGPLSGQRFAVSGDLKIGRDASNGVCFPADTRGVSGKHCILSARGSGLTLMDLGSTYGTFQANGTKLTPNSPVSLRRGDSFYVGSRSNTFRIE